MISRLNSPAYACPCPCFACALTSANAGLGVTVDSYSFDVGLFHPLLPAGLSRRTLTSPVQAEEVAERLLGVVAAPFSLAGTQVEQHASIGVVVWEGTSKDCTELLQNADVAMYEAKRQGESRHVVFTPAMYQDADNRFALTRELGHSL